MKSSFKGRVAASLLALAGTAGLLASCKDYLDIEPTALNTTDATFSTPAGATSAVIGAYNMLAGDNAYGTRVSLYFPLDTDELIGSGSAVIDNGRRGIARYKALSTNTEIGNPWIRLYQGVERANICIANIPTSPIYNAGAPADTAVMHRLHGEALALRAQYYLELVRNWGDVPAQFTPTVTGQADLANTDRNATLKRLLDDLAIAEKLLPWRSASGYSNQRYTKGAVKALRARIALQRGGYALYGNTITRQPDYLDYYRIARQECLDIMNHRSEHTLNSSFGETFRSINEQRTEAANELIMAVGMGGAGIQTDSKLGYYNGPRLTSSPTYGTSSGAITAAPPYFYAFDSTDTRRDITLTLYVIGSNNVQAGAKFSTVTDGKFRRDWRVPALPGTSNYLGYNWPLIRFADVELMYAETENEINGPTASAQQALLEVRTRGFGGNAARAAAGLTLTNKTDFFTAITNERYLEFGGEGIRKYDLLRWNMLAAKLADVKTKIASIQQGTVPYGPTGVSVVVPQTLYYKVVNGVLQFQRTFYKIAPSTAPAGSTSMAWASDINPTYVANTMPAGATYTAGGVTVASTSTGLAAEYVAGQGKELLPIPQATIDTDPAIKQNYGY